MKTTKTDHLVALLRNWFFKKKKLELRNLEQELKAYQHNLNNPKIELEEYEKQCLLNKIKISERKIGNCKDELAENEKEFENEKRELCLRLAYERKDLEPFLRESEH
ncbi:10841_t:CDS:2 [Funneliformis geosporum]|uniref:10841_t:CDS:1 n=1 Tax=Funneliformis geosporum TaxID=1117311 RepID=A0A9W4T395_9GLOM|nr:10841_t:CDS:2 [Funneliformis geosporum]